MSILRKNAINTSKVLTEALPFIQKFSGKNIVIKYGGSAMQNSFLRNSKSNIRSQWYTYTYFKKILNN